MPAFAHLGVDFAAKKVLPAWNVLLLILVGGILIYLLPLRRIRAGRN